MTEEEKAELAAHSRMMQCLRGHPIYISGAGDDTFWLIKEGQVRLSILGAGGKKITVALLGPGEIIGEMTVTGLAGYSEVAEAMTGCVLCQVPADYLRRIVQRRPDLSLRISKLIGLRRRQIANRIQDILFLTVPQRVARLLLRLADEFPGTTVSGRRYVNLILTHQEIADLIGSNREAVTAALRRLERLGYAKPVKRFWVLVDEEAMKREAGLLS